MGQKAKRYQSVGGTTALAVHFVRTRIDGCTLPKFYFDTFDGDQTAIDTDGIECPSRRMVQHQAIDALPDMAREILPDGPSRTFRVEVRDDGGNVVFRATLELQSVWLDGEGPQGGR